MAATAYWDIGADVACSKEGSWIGISDIIIIITFTRESPEGCRIGISDWFDGTLRGPPA
jgi:hypothetical protein